MFRKKLFPGTGATLRTGLKKAAIRMLGYDEKASRAVLEYFDLLSERYSIPACQIRIEIRATEKAPAVTLRINGKFERELSSDHLIHIFGGNAARIIPGLSKRAEEKVDAYLEEWAEKLESRKYRCFFRLMVLAGAPVLMVGVDEKVYEEISLTDAVAFFS